MPAILQYLHELLELYASSQSVSPDLVHQDLCELYYRLSGAPHVSDPCLARLEQFHQSTTRIHRRS